MRLARWLCVTLALTAPAVARAAEAPAEIKIGTLYARSGALASASMPLHVALEYWADGVNRGGGAYVKGFGKKIPVRLIAYDDQSSPSLAANLTNQLITQDKVDILTSDSTSIMTASAVPVARDHKMLLWNVTGSSPNFFNKDPYIVLLALTATDRYAKSLADFVALPTADGELVVAAANDRLSVKLAHVLDRPDWAADPRFASNAGRVEHKAEVIAAIGAIMAAQPSAHWAALFRAAGVPFAPINSLADLLDDPQVAALGMLQEVPGSAIPTIGLPVSFDGVRPAMRTAAPRLEPVHVPS